MTETGTRLSPTPRTTHRRVRHHGVADRAALADLLAAAQICHLGVVLRGVPMAFPTAYGYDLGGPDDGGTLYLHGSVASRSLAPEAEVSVTITLLDGLVLARSGFHHSMNYRSAMILGSPRVVTAQAELIRALDLIVDQSVPGRSQQLRGHSRKELAATRVLALPLREASVKARAGDPGDEAEDIAADNVWAGVVPLASGFATPVPSADLPARTELPPHLQRLLAGGHSRR